MHSVAFRAVRTFSVAFEFAVMIILVAIRASFMRNRLRDTVFVAKLAIDLLMFALQRKPGAGMVKSAGSGSQSE